LVAEVIKTFDLSRQSAKTFRVRISVAFEAHAAVVRGSVLRVSPDENLDEFRYLIGQNS
jgi:hypothetical protein